MENIKDYEITRKFFHQGRWFVNFRGKFNGKQRMPYANYVWLLNNQQFKDIPPGYVIHHLDGDEVNNDISNLALMKKQYHLAYHYKSKKNEESAERIRLRPTIGLGRDLTVPKISQSVMRDSSPIWRFRWQETDIGGKRISREISKIKDKIFRTKEDAERGMTLFMKIHPSFKSEEDMPKIYNLLQQINQEIESDETEDMYYLIKKTFPQI